MKNKNLNNELLLIGSRTKVNPQLVVAFKACINYCYVYMIDGKVMITSTNLGLIEDRFANTDFIRTHRSYFINLKYVKSFDAEKPVFAQMKNNLKVTISRRKRQNFIDQVSNFQNNILNN